MQIHAGAGKGWGTNRSSNLHCIWVEHILILVVINNHLSVVVNIVHDLNRGLGFLKRAKTQTI